MNWICSAGDFSIRIKLVLSTAVRLSNFFSSYRLWLRLTIAKFSLTKKKIEIKIKTKKIELHSLTYSISLIWTTRYLYLRWCFFFLFCFVFLTFILVDVMVFRHCWPSQLLSSHPLLHRSDLSLYQKHKIKFCSLALAIYEMWLGGGRRTCPPMAFSSTLTIVWFRPAANSLTRYLPMPTALLNKLRLGRKTRIFLLSIYMLVEFILTVNHVRGYQIKSDRSLKLSPAIMHVSFFARGKNVSSSVTIRFLVTVFWKGTFHHL